MSASRAAQLMKTANEDGCARGIDLATIQRYVNYWYCYRSISAARFDQRCGLRARPQGSLARGEGLRGPQGARGHARREARRERRARRQGDPASQCDERGAP
jgi:hypothetical protein